MLLMTFVYSSPANLWSDIRPSRTEMRFLMLTRLKFCPRVFELKKLNKLLSKGW